MRTKGPFVVVAKSTALLTVFYDLSENGLKIRAGFCYNIWMKGCGVLLFVAGF